MMSLLIWYWCIPFYFCPYITFPLSWIPQPHDTPVQPPAFHCTIGLALHMECTGNLWTSLLRFPFWTSPHAVFLITIFFSNLLIHHCDMWQFHPVTQLALTWASWSQVIAPHGQWVRGLLPFRHEWSLFSFFLDKSFCIHWPVISLHNREVFPRVWT